MDEKIFMSADTGAEHMDASGKSCKDNAFPEKQNNGIVFSDKQSSNEGLTKKQLKDMAQGNMSRETELKIAQAVKEKGGRAYYVGGCVRDKLMGRPVNDTDIEVHGLEPGQLFELLSGIGEPMSYGNSFGIYSLKGMDLDIAMPRREHATGRGHRDFEVFVDPFIGTEAAARRRDFTVNAIMEDVLSGELIDPFGGAADIRAGLLRHVDDSSFSEDALRVLRCGQFAARFGFKIHPSTLELCSGMDIQSLSRERVEGELKKALLQGVKPSAFFEFLRSAGQLDHWFAELVPLCDLEQDAQFHPEGDVWIHTMEVIDRAAELRKDAVQPYAFMLLALTHDLGKASTTELVNGRIHSYGHETAGAAPAGELLDRIVSEKAVKDYVLNMIPLHMKPNVTAFNRSAVKVTNRMFDQAREPSDLILMSMADRPLWAGDVRFEGDRDFLYERLEIYRSIMAQPYVQGRDLIQAGLKPGENFAQLLEYAHKLRLAGIEKDNALKQTLSYARKL